jgi:hypothetical protein
MTPLFRRGEETGPLPSLLDDWWTLPSAPQAEKSVQTHRLCALFVLLLQRGNVPEQGEQS